MVGRADAGEIVFDPDGKIEKRISSATLSALAAMIASRSEQCVALHAPAFRSSVVLTVKIAALPNGATMQAAAANARANAVPTRNLRVMCRPSYVLPQPPGRPRFNPRRHIVTIQTSIQEKLTRGERSRPGCGEAHERAILEAWPYEPCPRERCSLPTSPASCTPGATIPASAGAAVEGTLVSVDISGFTALAERLASLGPAGAEELVTHDLGGLRRADRRRRAPRRRRPEVPRRRTPPVLRRATATSNGRAAPRRTCSGRSALSARR